MLDGIPLCQLGIEAISNNYALPLTVLIAITFIPDLTPVDTNPVGHRSRAYSLDPPPTLPKAVVIGCGGGSCIRALKCIFEFTGVTDRVWRALECACTNGMATNATFKRTNLEDLDYGSWVKSLKAEATTGKTLGGPASWSRKNRIA